MSWTRTCLLALAISIGSLGAQAAGYPDRPIELIVPYGAGGANDVTARLVAQYLEKYLPGSARIVVVNKPGAGGEIGIRALLNAKPDGYTIGQFGVPTMLMKAHERETFWNVDSFAPLANMVYDPAIVALRSDSKINNAPQLFAAAKRAPDTLTVGILGEGSNDQLTFMDLEGAGGVKLRPIPFGGSAAARNAVLGGHVDLYVSTIGDVLPSIRNGQFKPIGIVTKERLTMAPEVPTFAEQGFDIKGRGSSSRGWVLHKDTPKEIVAVLSGAMDKVFKDPAFVAKATELGLPIRYMGPDEYGRFLHESNVWLAQLWRTNPWVNSGSK